MRKRNNRRGQRRRCVRILASTIVLAGCQSVPTGSRPAASAAATAPSAARLHAICGHVLEYYFLNKSLPPSLEDLRAVATPLVSPDSGKPYVYHQPSVKLAGRAGRLLVHDPTEAEATVKGEPGTWAILITKPEGERYISTHVALIPTDEIDAALAKNDPR
jgi:hypothetical protein